MLVFDIHFTDKLINVTQQWLYSETDDQTNRFRTVHPSFIPKIKNFNLICCVIRSENIPLRFQPLLWPWPWGQQSKTATKHAGSWWCATKHPDSWWCTTIPSLVPKVQETWNKQLFLRISARTVTVTLKIGTQTFCMTLQVLDDTNMSSFIKKG